MIGVYILYIIWIVIRIIYAPQSFSVDYYYYYYCNTTSNKATKPVASMASSAYMEEFEMMMDDGNLTDSIPETVSAKIAKNCKLKKFWIVFHFGCAQNINCQYHFRTRTWDDTTMDKVKRKHSNVCIRLWAASAFDIENMHQNKN